jgi:hypothetical protein
VYNQGTDKRGFRVFLQKMIHLKIGPLSHQVCLCQIMPIQEALLQFFKKNVQQYDIKNVQQYDIKTRQNL